MAANLMGRAGDMTGDAESLDGLRLQYSVAALASTVAIVAAALAVRIVVALSARVDTRSRRAP